jgi:hypothetical protein
MTKQLELFLANGGRIEKCPAGAAWGVRTKNTFTIRGNRSKGRAWKGMKGRKAFLPEKIYQ